VDKAESAAEYALLLDDQSAEAFAALGHVKVATRDYSGAEAALKKAIALNPNDVRAHMSLALVFGRHGKEDEAFALVKKALELHPMSGELNHWMGDYHNNAIMRKKTRHRDWDMAFKYYKRAMDRDPDFYHPYYAVGQYYVSTGQLDQAIPYFRKVVDLSTGPTKSGQGIGRLTSIYVDIGDYASAAQVIRRSKELEPDKFGAIDSEIHLQLARRDFPAARDIIHRTLPANIDKDRETSLMAFYEMVVGDTGHAEEIYTRFAAAPEPCAPFGPVDLCSTNELQWGMLGAVNLAYLHKRNGDTPAARELLGNAREYIEFKTDRQWFVNVNGSLYVLAQIAALEGDNDAAIEYVREAVDAGWSKAWFGRIDPIMADLRKDARYLQMLDELEDKLLNIRERTKVLASNEP